MAKPEIIDKLNTFLIGRNPFTEECQAVYLMVQLRKLLDHQADRGGFAKLRFYCDWAVHTDKTRNLAHLRPVIEEVFAGVKATMATYPMVNGHQPVVDFLYLRDLRREMETFFADQELSYQQLDDRWWHQFVKMMVNVLSNQPIRKPIPQVKLFTFTDATPRSVFLKLEFTEPIADRQGRGCT